MGTAKKPDNVVYNIAKEEYDASMRPYATNTGAPAITVPDTIAWKNRNINKANQQIGAKYHELKAAYDTLMEQFEYNNLVYGAKFNFEPIVGETYYLYRNASAAPFLSVIAPDECNFDHMGSFRLNTDQLWEQVKQE